VYCRVQLKKTNCNHSTTASEYDDTTPLCYTPIKNTDPDVLYNLLTRYAANITIGTTDMYNVTMEYANRIHCSNEKSIQSQGNTLYAIHHV